MNQGNMDEDDEVENRNSIDKEPLSLDINNAHDQEIADFEEQERRVSHLDPAGSGIDTRYLDREGENS